MERLWEKEIDRSATSYVDLFASVKNENKLTETDWDSMNSYRSFKDDQHSTELRMKGNVKFRLGLYAEAIKLYTQSLCFAEIASINVGLAYASRSVCFFKMKLFDQTLIDIELAKTAKCSERLMLQLEERKRQCMNPLTSTGQPSALCSTNTKEIPKSRTKLNFKTDPNYPCMANVLEIKQNQQFGRHLIAKCDIPAGQTILIEEDFVSIKSDGEPACYTCFQENVNFIACRECPDAVFCSTQCMNRNLIHHWECGTFFAQLHHKIQFQIRSILVALQIFSNVHDLMNFVEFVLNHENIPTSMHDLKSKYHFFLKLEPSKVVGSKDLVKIYKIYVDLMLLPKVCALFDSEEKQRFLMHLVVHHFLVLKNNSIACGKPWSITAAFNVLSMMNHSCAPNVYHPRIGSRQHCVTIRPVKRGEQLFISYLLLGHNLLTEQRQEKLQTAWGFLCKCEMCEPIERPFVDLLPATSDLSYHYVIENYDNDISIDENDILMQNCIEFLNRYGHLEWSMEIFTIAAILVNLYVERNTKLD